MKRLLSWQNYTQILIVLFFVIFSLSLVPYHEFWADEVQAFLVARDADWYEILTLTPQREGQPVLWHCLLKICIQLFGTGFNMCYLSVAIMSIAVALMVFKYNIPLLYKILIPFGYSFLYQYNIVARNYGLAYLGLILIGLFYRDRHQKIWPYILSVAFLAETTSFYLPVVAVLACSYLFEIYTKQDSTYKNYVLPLLLLISIGLSLLWQILPINYTSYNIRPQINFLSFFLGSFFASDNISLSLCFLLFFSIYIVVWVIRKCTTFSVNYNTILVILLWIAFIIFLVIIQPRRHHQGLVWGLFLWTLYIINCTRKNFFLTCLLLIQIQWSICALKYEIEEVNSPQKNVITWLKNNNLSQEKIFPVGFQTLPFQAIYPLSNLIIPGRDSLYLVHSDKEHPAVYDYHTLLRQPYKVILVDATATHLLKQQYSDELNQLNYHKKYFKFVFCAALNDKGLPGYFVQHLTIYIAKDLWMTRHNISFTDTN